MTTISSSSAALSILQQTSSLADPKNQSAADTILDIVSGRTGKVSKAANDALDAAVKASAEAKKPREAGGTVSSELSQASLSAMDAAASYGLQGGGPQIDFRPYEATAENAKGFAEAMVGAMQSYNEQFHLVAVPTREEWTARVLAGEAYSIARGADPEATKQLTEIRMSDEGYRTRLELIDRMNKATLLQAQEASKGLEYVAGHLSDTFGVKAQISYNEKGEAKIGAFDIYSGSGQKMLSYDGNGGLTSYEVDGNVSK